MKSSAYAYNSERNENVETITLSMKGEIFHNMYSK